MQEFIIDEIKIQIDGDKDGFGADLKKALRVSSPPELEFLRSQTALKEDMPWVKAIEEEGFSQLSEQVLFTKGTRNIDLSMSQELKVEADDGLEEMFLVIASDPGSGKILSVKSTGLNPLDGQVERGGAFRFHLSFSNVVKPVLHFFKKIIRRITHNIKEFLYDKVDSLIFEPDDGWGLKSFKMDGSTAPLDTTFRQDMSGKRCLVFIHGIFSNVVDAFKPLASSAMDQHDSVLKQLEQRYEQRIYAFDHPTVSETALENGVKFIESLPEQTTIDLICHSRGGLVSRCILEHPQIRALTDKKKIEFGRVLFVAGACKGSPLASDEFLNDFFLLSTAIGLIPGIKVLVKILEVIAKTAHNAPGVTCLDPSSELVQTLDNNTGNNLAEQLSFCRANFAQDAVLADIADEIVIDRIAFNNNANDVVVPYDTADISDEYQQVVKPKIVKGVCFNSDGSEQNAVWHLKYFEQKAIQQQILSVMS